MRDARSSSPLAKDHGNEKRYSRSPHGRRPLTGVLHAIRVFGEYHTAHSCLPPSTTTTTRAQELMPPSVSNARVRFAFISSTDPTEVRVGSLDFRFSYRLPYGRKVPLPPAPTCARQAVRRHSCWYGGARAIRNITSMSVYRCRLHCRRVSVTSPVLSSPLFPRNF